MKPWGKTYRSRTQWFRIAFVAVVLIGCSIILFLSFYPRK